MTRMETTAELKQRIAELELEVRKQQSLRKSAERTIEQLDRRVAELEDENARLQSLRGYVRHDFNCHAQFNDGVGKRYDCSCGLSAALASQPAPEDDCCSVGGAVVRVKQEANADIVRRLVELCEDNQLRTREWDELHRDAKAALHAAGGKDNGTD